MDSIVKRRKYVEIDVLFQTQKKLTLKNHANEIKIYKETIELLFYLRDILDARIREDTRVSGKPLSGPKALIPILYDRNNHYLIAAYKLTSNCLINPAYLNLRVVFETILQIYLLHLTKNEADLVYKKQLDILNKDEQKDLNTNYGGLKPFKVRNILYSDKKRFQINESYKQLSNSAHPSIESAMNDFDYRDETVTDALHLTLALSCANIIAIHETFFDKFIDKEITEISNTFDKIEKELGFRIDMVPNNPNLTKKPIIVL